MASIRDTSWLLHPTTTQAHPEGKHVLQNQNITLIGDRSAEGNIPPRKGKPE